MTQYFDETVQDEQRREVIRRTIAVDIAQQIMHAELKCPACYDDMKMFGGQPLVVKGEDDITVFCPHCEIEILVQVSAHFDLPSRVRSPLRAVGQIPAIQDCRVAIPTAARAAGATPL